MFNGALTVPQLFLSSTGTGREDLALFAYHEPMQLIDDPDGNTILLSGDVETSES